MVEDRSASAPVVNIARKTDELRQGIRDSLAARGEAHVDLAGSRVTTDEWRKLARAAARELGRPVETVAHDQRAWAVLRDWPANDEERVVHEAAMRDAMSKISLGPSTSSI